MDALVAHIDRTPEHILEDYHDMAQLVAYIVGEDPEGQVPNDMIHLFCRHSRNSYAIQDSELQSVGVALYPTISFINHSCDPNAFLCQDGPSGSINVYKDLEPGDQIFVSYVETLETRMGRREGLQEEYFFECQCPVCSSEDPVDIREAVKCSSPNCPQLLPQSATVCDKCTTPLAPMNFAHALEFQVLASKDDLSQTAKMEQMEKALRARFPDTNVLVIQLWKSLLVAYLYEQNFEQAFLMATDYMGALDFIYPEGHPTKSFLAYSLFLIAPNVTGLTGHEYFDVSKRAHTMLLLTHGPTHRLTVETGRALDAFYTKFPDLIPR